MARELPDLSGHADDDRGHSAEDETGGPASWRARAPRRGLGWPAVLVSCLAALAIGAVVTALLVRPTTPDTRSAEAGFARDMQIHHAQGVEMSMIVRDRTTDPETRTLAYDIALTQQQQSGQMFAWLVQWGLPQARSGPVMAWMNGAGDHAMASMSPGSSSGAAQPAAMPGMATADQVQTLRESDGTAAEVLFLQLMIAHHRGGIVMADAVLQRSDDDVVTTFARTMRTAQQNEIVQMQTMLAARGA